MSYSFPSPPLSTPGNAREEIINQFAPFSRLSLSAETFCNIVDFCEDVTTNRHAVQQLKNSCYLLLLTAKQSEERMRTNSDSGNIITLVDNVLLSVKSRIHRWSLLLELDAIAQRNEIEGEIKYCHICLSDCMGHFHNEIYSWREGFVTNCQLDYRDIVEYLSATRNESDILEQAGSGRGDLVKQVIELMQSILNEGTITDHERSGLSRNLYRLQLHCNEILSGIRKELFTGNLPYSGTQYVDIYRGTYLQCEEVAVKVMRSTSFNEHSLRRFNREVKVWAKIWKVDRGRHIVPFYGHGTDDRPIPFFVSPWQPNGNARSYVQSRDLGAEEYRQMIKNIALGIEVLHSMSPPIVHGDINATNILINSQGQPLLADFGVSQMLQDVNGVPLTQSGGMSHAPRWFAPEVWTDGGKLSSMSDIYSYGMTVLELFTHEKPYADIRHTPQATLLASKGTCPKRPSAAEVIERGMDDNIWTLLTQCWSLRPEARPKIQAVLDELAIGQGFRPDTRSGGAGRTGNEFQDGLPCKNCSAPARSRSYENIRPRRLVEAQSLTIVEFGEDDIVPPYAILSHRWLDGEEVVLSELSNNIGEETKLKLGYRKIDAACRLVIKSGLRYLWVDTCCMDHDDPDDVTLNIKQMYIYYANAEICYAYLWDVHGWQFHESDWFYRGWTLQELLAPREVVFFDKDWTRVGCKHELSIRDKVSPVTMIPLDVLCGQKPIRDVEPIERMTWAIDRATSKEEDQAYCLLGLLGVSMEPRYREGVRESFRRLRAAFVNAYPDQTDGLGSVADFYSFLQERHRRDRRRTIADLISRRQSE